MQLHGDICEYLEDGRGQRFHADLAIEGVWVECGGQLVVLIQGQRRGSWELHQRLMAA
jgi:hypothetical protein